jgi:hypothetical protein
VSEKRHFADPADHLTPCRNSGFGANRAMMSSKKTHSGAHSDHFDGRQFYDPDGVPPKSLREVLRWQFGRGRQRQAWPVWAPSPHADTPPARVSGGKVRLSFVGRSRQLADPGRRCEHPD